MNEIQPYQTTPLAAKIDYAKHLAEAGMVPAAYKKQPANILVAIEMGEALGIKPIVAMNEINVISGTPAPSASLMASLARAAGHKLRAWNDSPTSAVCEIIRADDPDFTHTAKWDEKKARAVGLWDRGHWKKDAETMLRWRAISEAVRLACPEVLGGLRYTPDEVVQIKSGNSQQPHIEAEVAPPAVEAAPQIPTTLLFQIQSSDDQEWLTKTSHYLSSGKFDQLGEKLSEHLNAIADRLTELDTSHDDAETTLADVLDAETEEP